MLPTFATFHSRPRVASPARLVSCGLPPFAPPSTFGVILRFALQRYGKFSKRCARKRFLFCFLTFKVVFYCFPINLLT